MNISDVLVKYYTGKWIRVGDDYESIDWIDGDKPTLEELESKWVLLLEDRERESYKGKRAAEYPSVAEQLDKIYHGGIAAWKAEIKLIKDKYPKPE